MLSTRKNYKRGFCFVRQDATFLLRAGGTSVPRLTLHYRPAQARSHDGMLIQSDVVPALPRNTCLVPDLAEPFWFGFGSVENRGCSYLISVGCFFSHLPPSPPAEAKNPRALARARVIHVLGTYPKYPALPGSTPAPANSGGFRNHELYKESLFDPVSLEAIS